MKGNFTIIGIIIFLLLTISVSEGQIDAAVNVAKALVTIFSKDEENVTDLTAADELARGLTFDMFEEKVSCRVVRGVLVKDYSTIVENFARRFSIPADVESSLLDGQYAEDLVDIIRNFKFEKGKTGDYVYGRVATVKHGDKIDMAYSVYTLQFKLSPTVIEHRKKKKFLWFTTGEKVWRETKERNLSTKEKDRLQNYFMIKAIEVFRSEYAGLIEASNHDEL